MSPARIGGGDTVAAPDTGADTGPDGAGAVRRRDGLAPFHRAMVTAAVLAEAGRLLVLCADEKEARRQAARSGGPDGADAGDAARPGIAAAARRVHSRQWENSRLAALHRMAGSAAIVVAAVDGMVQRCIHKRCWRTPPFTLEVGGQYDVTALAGISPPPGTAGATRWKARGSSRCGAAFWMCSRRTRSSRVHASSLTTSWTAWATSP